ncbi:metal-dependent transcriptional regulator [Sharpea azabuensis]|uniref:Metal-dependent transcriptional regulator n=1 Tax=Sharpea porci TaxID=2652286 RepID=A0A844FVZ2_9FIRM|nr:metal-dependent transcriptional regulator [Sharpea porci]MDY5278777.1 metal-dependent transcriptional regulator [Sharpea porci]MST89510.1 metal-dependent transcriptional regulator [Sharpea porci]
MSKHEMKMYQSTEDYLEAILMIKQEKGYCRSIDIAKRLDFKKSSVSIAISKLTHEGYVIKEEDGMLELTEEGSRLANDILERHNFFLNWLRSLGVEEEQAYDDACRMEHAMCNDTFHKIVNYVRGRNDGNS